MGPLHGSVICTPKPAAEEVSSAPGILNEMVHLFVASGMPSESGLEEGVRCNAFGPLLPCDLDVS